MSYAELQVTTHFSFLRGASSPEELFSAAALLGVTALGVTDRNSLAGIVRAYEAAKVTGVNLIVGCRLDLEDFPSLLVYPTDRKAYARLCRLLTIGKGRAGKGKCQLFWKDVQEWSEGLIAILVTKDPSPELAAHLNILRSEFGDRAYCALTRRFRPNDVAKLHAIAETARLARMPAVVTGDVLYHTAEQRMLQDVVTCIRLRTTIDKAGFLKEKHADRFLKTPDEMARLFKRYPDAVARTLEISRRCTFSLDELSYSYPTEVNEDGLSAQDRLEKLTWEGAALRYPEGLPDTVAMQLRHELNRQSRATANLSMIVLIQSQTCQARLRPDRINDSELGPTSCQPRYADESGVDDRRTIAPRAPSSCWIGGPFLPLKFDLLAIRRRL